jgi:hypothetical protein
VCELNSISILCGAPFEILQKERMSAANLEQNQNAEIRIKNGQDDQYNQSVLDRL